MSAIPKKLLCLTGFVIIVTTLFFCLTGSTRNTDVKEYFSSLMRNDKLQQKTFQDINLKIQNIRKDYIHTYCTAEKVPKLQANAKEKVKVLYNEKYKISAILIPKIGTTFMKQMFAVLKHGPMYAKYNLTTPRDKVKQTYPRQRLFLKNQDNTIVPARNPFSRLYSAFVDKVYLPNSIKLGLDIISHKIRPNSISLMSPSRKQSRWLSITFQDFLIYALDPLVKGKILNSHYNPCFPRIKVFICNFYNKYFIVKQETFESDFKYFLQSVCIDERVPETYKAMIRSLYESHIEDSVPGLIKSTCHRAQRYGDAKVWTGRIVAERLWHSFQIQGYISKHMLFPRRYFNSEQTYSNVSFIVKTFLLEMKMGNFSQIESTKQRKEAMSLAYKSVSKDVIRKIQHIYNCDFQSFGYDLTF